MNAPTLQWAQDGRRRRRFARRETVRRVRRILVRVWNGIWWIWSVVIVGGLVAGMAVSYLLHGTLGVEQPADWYTVQLLLAHPVVGSIGSALGVALSVAAFIAYRQERAAVLAYGTVEYVVQRVDRVRPLACGLERYVDAVYLRRREAKADGDADMLAHTAVRAAAEQVLRRVAHDDSDGGNDTPIGICVFGRPMAGKRRLAWEAVQDELPGWTLVRWPPNPTRSFDLAALKGRPVVLWLDRLSLYTTAGQGPTVQDLPRQLREIGSPVVVVATCRLNEDEETARANVGSLLRRLRPIYLADISREEGAGLVKLLAKEGVKGDLEEFDGTPGSVLLGVAHMRDDIYPRLRVRHPRAAMVLRTMKLLHSAGVRTYPAARVRAAANAVFGLRKGDWRAARDDLLVSGFVRVGQRRTDGERDLEPVAEVYLTQCITRYPPTGVQITDDWPPLEQSLLARRDGEALEALGHALVAQHKGVGTQHADDLRPNYQRAQRCFGAALEAVDRDADPQRWARLQRSLGSALFSEGGLTINVERGKLLRAAEEAFRAVLMVPEPDSADVVAQRDLGKVLYLRAEQSGGEERDRLFLEAESMLRRALEGTDRGAAPRAWSDAIENLGVVLGERAKDQTGVERQQLLDEAISAHRSALEIQTRDKDPQTWTTVQNNLGVVLSARANDAKGEGRQRLLEEAEKAYRAAVSVPIGEQDPSHWLTAQTNLGSILVKLAAMASGARRLDLALDAQDVYFTLLDVVSVEREPKEWADAQQGLGDVYLFLGGEEAGTLREGRWLRADEAYRAALRIFTREHFPVKWAQLQLDRAQVALNLAVAVPGKAADCAGLLQGRQYMQHALTVLTEEHTPGPRHSAEEVATAIEKAIENAGCAGKTDARVSDVEKAKDDQVSGDNSSHDATGPA